MLLRAFQAENELAAQRIKQLQGEQQRQAAAAAEQREELQQALLLARQDSERRPPGTPALEAARLQELLSMQAELERAREGAAQRERELQQQVLGWAGWRLAGMQVLPGVPSGVAFTLHCRVR